MSLNNVSLSGRITHQPEIKYTPNGMAVCSFSLAVTRNFKDSDGNYGTDFINCVSFSKTAELVANYFTKGQMMIVNGRIQTRSYENKEGRKVNVFEIICDQVHFADSKKDNNNQQQNDNAYNDNPFMEIPTDDVGQKLPF